MPDFHDFVLHKAGELLAASGPAAAKSQALLRLLARARSQLIGEQLRQWGGDAVRSGPFAGLQLGVPITEGCTAPKLLGSYEAELHPVWDQVRRLNYQQVVDVGCAEGYYAVGLARMLPGVRVEAFDRNEAARRSCLQLAEINGLAGRVQVGGELVPQALRRFAGPKTLLVCDIEGGELDLLDPHEAPALAGFDLLVELHELFRPGLTAQLTARFAASHRLELIPCAGRRDIGQWPELARLDPLDRLLAVWEWRMGDTPWAWLRSRRHGE